MTMKNSSPPVSPLAVSPENAALMAGVCRGTIYTALKEGSLLSSKIGTRRLITVVALKEWLQRNEDSSLNKGKTL